MNRREFLKRVGVSIGASGMFLSTSVRRAYAIDPQPGTTWEDAEHVVILMQENRSFDHLYGSLRGVRGFDDPRAVQLPNGNPVWCQSFKNGDTYAPWRLDIKNTSVTWLGSLPHGWTDQTDARNHGKHDGWLEAKRSGNRECHNMPFTMGAYTRDDVSFYYELADAFTICDQHFCSSLTGTMPNRLYLWSGTIRGSRDASARARVDNSDVEYENSCSWTTFPERLEELGVSWKVYQNEISSVDVGLSKEDDKWLSNYGDNPLEWFPQYHTGFSATHRARLESLVASLPARIDELRHKLADAPESQAAKKALAAAEKKLLTARARLEKFTDANFQTLSTREKNLFEKGLSTNSGDPDYRKVTTLTYQDGSETRQMDVPKGDVLHQFREDVSTGKLPAVSWIVAPEHFSDHPSSAWFGAWYVSEVMNILTKNPEVWKKTIFILTYDENDGYFDHVAPFAAPHPHRPETGMTSAGINTEEDFVTMEEEKKTKEPRYSRESSIGLGFRVPLVIASPWSRGGFVCSQVFDHTSPLQFLEKFLSKKTGKPVHDGNISDWRRTVCGDLTSSFRSYNGGKNVLPAYLEKDPFVELIHKAQFKPFPTGFNKLADADIARLRDDKAGRGLRLRQEPGQRSACAVPYDLMADGSWNDQSQSFELNFSARADRLARASGSGFNVYAPAGHKSLRDIATMERCRNWNFAVAAGATVRYEWKAADFEDGHVLLAVHGPNGFFREWRMLGRPPVTVIGEADLASEQWIITVSNALTADPVSVELRDESYGGPVLIATIAPGHREQLRINTKPSFGWYDAALSIKEDTTFSVRYAGHIETGRDSMSDPIIGKPV